MNKMIDRKKLLVKDLGKRVNDLNVGAIMGLNPVPCGNNSLAEVGKRIVRARRNGRSVILMAGGHVLRDGVQRYLIDLMERGYVSCLAFNGSGMIHDYEFALIGATTESVSKYIRRGEFGLWKETGFLNDHINKAHKKDKKVGMGEAIGGVIENGNFPHKEISVLAAGYRLGIPVTIHVGIGYDILHEHPNCDGAATGALSYNDFLRYASVVQNLEGGVAMNFGSSVMAPEIYLKALSMARNIARQKRGRIAKFSTLVCDLHQLSGDVGKEPKKSDAQYYFRPWKTMLVRTVQDGGESFYVKGRHGDTIPELWSQINRFERGPLATTAKGRRR
ncbi:MAG: hypothetical protein HY280_03165 [Nitrospinae bacterium]|nr:hypothetical protein [Nitrospinota bacterium]